MMEGDPAEIAPQEAIRTASLLLTDSISHGFAISSRIAWQWYHVYRVRRGKVLQTLTKCIFTLIDASLPRIKKVWSCYPHICVWDTDIQRYYHCGFHKWEAFSKFWSSPKRGDPLVKLDEDDTQSTERKSKCNGSTSCMGTNLYALS